jgi:hypothetical protein
MKTSDSNHATNNLAKFNTIIIGDNLDALVYAHLNDCHILFNNISPPTIIDFFDSDLDLSMFGIENDGNIAKLDLWRRLRYSMSMAGKIINSQAVTSIGIEDQQIKVFTDSSKKYEYEFENMVIFDVEKLTNLKYTMINEDKNTVYDWISVNHTGKHDIDVMDTGDDLTNKVYFYKSVRNGVINTHKDIVAVSYLTDEQLNSQDYSDTIVRMKIKRMMKKAGIRGPKNGLNPNYPDRSDQKYKYRPLGIEYEYRQVIRGKKTVEIESENIDFVDIDTETLISKHKKISDINKCLKYLRRLV